MCIRIYIYIYTTLYAIYSLWIMILWSAARILQALSLCASIGTIGVLMCCPQLRLQQSRKILSDSQRQRWDLRPERHARVPQELHCSGNFHPWRCSLWKLYCGDFCRNGMCRMDLKNTFLEIHYSWLRKLYSLALSARSIRCATWTDGYTWWVSLSKTPSLSLSLERPSINHSWGFRSADLKTYILPCTWFVAWVFCNSWTVTGKKRILIALSFCSPSAGSICSGGFRSYCLRGHCPHAVCLPDKVWLHRLGIETLKL